MSGRTPGLYLSGRFSRTAGNDFEPHRQGEGVLAEVRNMNSKANFCSLFSQLAAAPANLDKSQPSVTAVTYVSGGLVYKTDVERARNANDLTGRIGERIV
jgi:hypothetical protein